MKSIRVQVCGQLPARYKKLGDFLKANSENSFESGTDVEAALGGFKSTYEYM